MQTIACQARCPGCGEPLAQLDLADAVVAGCMRCGGLWVDNRVGHIVLAGSASDALEAFAEALADAARKHSGAPPPGYRSRGVVDGEGRACPVCNAPLSRQRLRDGNVEVDLCGAHGTFFDVYEFVAVTQSIEVRRLGQRAQQIETQRRIAESRSNEAAGAFVLSLFAGPRRGSQW